MLMLGAKLLFLTTTIQTKYAVRFSLDRFLILSPTIYATALRAPLHPQDGTIDIREEYNEADHGHPTTGVTKKAPRTSHGKLAAISEGKKEHATDPIDQALLVRPMFMFYFLSS